MRVYAALLARPGARALALACVAGWASFAGLVLAVVLLVQDRTGSFALAGACTGALSGGAGLVAPLRGRVVDHRGGPALVAFGAAHTAAVAALLLVAGHGPGALAVAAAGAVGVSAPPLIASARAAWPRISGPDLARAAHAVNALLGDAAAVLSPLAVGLVAAAAGPAWALGAIAAGPLAGCLIIARIGLPGAPRPAGGRSVVGALASGPGIRTMVAGMVPLGVAMGALEVSAPAMAAAEGAPERAAIPLAAFAATSVACSLWVGHSLRAGSARRRVVAGGAALAVALVPCALVDSVRALAVVLAVAGLAFGLLNTGAFEILDDLVAPGHAIEALTWMTTSEGLGMAAGAAAAGVLAGSGTAAAMALVSLAPLAGAAVLVARRGTLRSVHA